MTKDIDWSSLSFGYIKTDYRYVSNYKDGKWDDGALTTDPNVTINESAGVLQYAQTGYEGLKAYRTKDGKVVCFRPDLNAKRMGDTARQLEMPVFPEDRFIDAVEKVVKAHPVLSCILNFNQNKESGVKRVPIVEKVLFEGTV